jgi:tRNA pseudouridine55 synthase
VARKAKGEKIDGWVILDKPKGVSSTQAMARVRRAFGAAKAGHAGTLDPLATGVLPIALGEATKTVPFVAERAKRYRFTIRWGEARTTDDAEGDVVARSQLRPNEGEIRAALPRFRGAVGQVPPAFSAIKIAGRPAYARARSGEVLAMKSRIVTIERFDLEAMPDADHAIFIVQCSKGTYIRSLARDLAKALGTLGYVAELRRLAVGNFTESAAIGLDNVEQLRHSPARFAHLRAVETALDDIPALAVTEAESRLLRQGQAVRIASAADSDDACALRPGQVVSVTHHGRLVALTRFEGGRLRPLRVLNL